MGKNKKIIIASVLVLAVCAVKLGYDTYNFRTLKSKTIVDTNSAVRLINMATKYSELMIVEQMVKSIKPEYKIQDLDLNSVSELGVDNGVVDQSKVYNKEQAIDKQIDSELEYLNSIKTEDTKEQIDGLNESIRHKYSVTQGIDTKLAEITEMINSMTFTEYEFKGGEGRIRDYMAELTKEMK